MTIVTLKQEEDKFRIYTGRERLRNNSVRVSDDLTKMQRQELKSLKEKGKFRYYRNGKLQIRERSNELEQRTRIFIKGNRRGNNRHLGNQSTITINKHTDEQLNSTANPYEMSTEIESSIEEMADNAETRNNIDA